MANTPCMGLIAPTPVRACEIPEILIFFPEPDCAQWFGSKALLLSEIPLPNGFKWPRRCDVFERYGVQYVISKMPVKRARVLGQNPADCWEILTSKAPFVGAGD